MQLDVYMSVPRRTSTQLPCEPTDSSRTIAQERLRKKAAKEAFQGEFARALRALHVTRGARHARRYAQRSAAHLGTNACATNKSAGMLALPLLSLCSCLRYPAEPWQGFIP
jgi:hypothetical protein